MILSCDGEDRCSGKAGGGPALEIHNLTNCDLEVRVDSGPSTFAPAGVTTCKTDFEPRPFTGNHRVEAVPAADTLPCEIVTVDFGNASAEETGPAVDYSPVGCSCESK